MKKRLVKGITLATQVGTERPEEKEVKLPFWYRWILKLPAPNMFLSRRFPVITGLLLFGILPTLIVFFSFFGVFFILASPVLDFPLNYILALLVPGVFALFWLRLQLERALNWWKSMREQPMHWDVEKSVEEYTNLLKEQRKKKEAQG